MIYNFVAFRDWETGGKNKLTCQPLELACVIIDVKRLEVVPNSLFHSLLKPEEDEAIQKRLGLAPLEDDALKKNGLKIEDLRKAPKPKVVWDQYVEYLSHYNTKGESGDDWHAPIRAGFNNVNFDDYIDKRMCSMYGPKLSDNGDMTIYHPSQYMDANMLCHAMFNYHYITKNNRMSMDAIREYMGYKTDGAHSASVDVMQGADLLIRFFRLNRHLIEGKIDMPLGKKIKFKGCVNGKL